MKFKLVKKKASLREALEALLDGNIIKNIGAYYKLGDEGLFCRCGSSWMLESHYCFLSDDDKATYNIYKEVKKRPMTIKELREEFNDSPFFCLKSDLNPVYSKRIAIINNNFIHTSSGFTPYIRDIDGFHKVFTRPDGSKFEVEE